MRKLIPTVCLVEHSTYLISVGISAHVSRLGGRVHGDGAGYDAHEQSQRRVAAGVLQEVTDCVHELRR